METLYDTAVQTIQRYQMLIPTDTVVVACSGGADSVALLHLMCRLKEQGAVQRIVAAHMNHGIRGNDAQQDADFVRSLAEANGCLYEQRDVDIPRIAREDKMGLEETGRRERYRFFEYLSQKYQNAKIATAHTANDNTETILFRMARGTGVMGLCGIPAVRGNIIRPLIHCTRAQIESCLQEIGLPYRTDSTNEQITYARNRIRHMVMPHLRHINPQCDEAFARTAAQISQINEYMQQQAVSALETCRTAESKALSLSCSALADLHPTVRGYLWRLCLLECGVEPQSILIDRAEQLLLQGGSYCLREDLRMQCDGVTWCVQDMAEPPLHSIPQPCKAIFDAEQRVGEYIFFLCDQKEIAHSRNVHNLFEIYAVDRDKIEGTLYFRNRLPADSFKTGKRVTKTLKDLFYEAKLQPSRRQSIPLLCDGKGIVCIPSFGTAARAAVTEQTKNVLYIAIKRERVENEPTA